jgi:Uncharacterised nucleotidyltransferase
MSDGDRRDRAARWLARACRRFLLGDPEGECPLTLDVDLAGQGGAVERLAVAHAIEPLLHAMASTSRIDRSTLSEPLREGWLAAYCWTLLSNRRRLKVLGEAFELCRDRSLDLVALKGPVHIARVYGDPGLRPMVDLDLLCREAQLAPVVDVFRSLGYEPTRVTSLFHLALRHRERAEMIELHFDLYELLADRLSFVEGLLGSAVDCEVAGTRIRAAAPEQAIVVDLAHLVNHDLRIGLRQAVDFSGQLLAEPSRSPRSMSPSRPLDRDRLRHLLEQVDLLSEHAAVAALFEHLLDLEPQSLDGPEGRTAKAELVRQTRELWGRMDELPGPPFLAEVSYRSGFRPKLGYLWRLLGPGLLNRGRAGGVGGGANSELSWVRHLSGLLRNGWRKLRSGGTHRGGSLGGPAQAVSLKREVYGRRTAGGHGTHPPVSVSGR